MKRNVLLAIAALTSPRAITARRAAPSSSRFRARPSKVLVYEKKTFDSENMNAKDAAVLVTFKKDAKSGQFEYWGIEFIPL